MYHFKEDYDRIGHFWFDKQSIKNMNWALLPKSSKTVYPVIAAHRNGRTGEAFPSEQTIAILSGRTDKVVRNGIKELHGYPGLEITQYITAKGQRSRKFQIDKPPEDVNRAFPFYNSVFHSGIWSQLRPSAQALYPVMRHFGYFNPEVYMEIEDEYDTDDQPHEIFPRRKWDACQADMSVLAEYAGISRRSVSAAICSLSDTNLVEEAYMDDLSFWKVYVRPPVYYKRSYLNKQIAEKYQHLKD